MPATLGLIAILIAAAALRIYLFRGYIGLDDGEYAYLAHKLAQGAFVRADYPGPVVFPLRVGVIVPAAVLFGAFGVSERTLAIYPLVLSVLGIALAYACTSLFFGKRAGLIAAALLAVFPADIESSTQLLADLPSALYGAAAVTLIAYGARKPDLRRRAYVGWGFAAGLLLGLAWLCKESVSFMAPFLAIWVAIGVAKGGRGMLWIAAGVAAGGGCVLAGEMIAYWSLTGDWLFRFHEVERNYQQNQKYFFAEGSRFGWDTPADYPRALFNRLFVSGPSMIFLNPTYLFLPLVGIAVTAYAAFRRDRAFLVPALWLWTLVLMFNFSSTSTSAYTPLALFNRYLYPIFYPAVVLAAGFLASLSAGRPRFRARPALALFHAGGFAAAIAVMGFGGIDLLRAVKYPPRWLTDVRHVKPLIAADTKLYSDTLTLRAFAFLSGYPERTAWVDFKDLPPDERIAPGSLVVVNRPSIAWLELNGGLWGSVRSGYRQHEFYASPPHSWTPVWQSSKMSVYRAQAFAGGHTP